MEQLDEQGSLRDGNSTGKENDPESFATGSGRLRRRTSKEPHSPADVTGVREGGRRLSGLSYHSVDDGDPGTSAMDSVLETRPAEATLADHLGPSNWHSAPLAFALLPAVAGLIFQNGSAIVTDVTLLAFAGVFLNWSVRMPWYGWMMRPRSWTVADAGRDWYRSAQSVRVLDAQPTRNMDREGPSVNGTATPGSRRPSGELSCRENEQRREAQNDARQAASAELRIHERLALLSCFLLPLGAAVLLHAIRGQLSRPSEGLVSNYNLTIFLLASEMRPLAHLLKMIQARTLHLQRSVHANPLERADEHHVDRLAKRLEKLEARLAPTGRGRPGSGERDAMHDGTTTVTSDVRRTLQPDLDALNRAVRRYEKRATVQTMQTESRLQELEARLHDAIALAAAAAQSGQQWRPSSGPGVRDWVWAAAMLPMRTTVALLKLPAKASTMILGLGRALMVLSSHRAEESTSDTSARPNGRLKERSVKRAGKRTS